MKRLTKLRGMSLVELLITVAISAGGLIFLISGMSQFQSQAHTIKTNTRISTAVAEALDEVIKIGRSAQSCTRHSGPPITLDCMVDMNPASTAVTSDDTRVRVFQVNSASGESVLKFEKLKPGATVWEPMREFPYITSFEVCDSTMFTGVTPTCPLPNSPLYSTVTSPRFFRVGTNSTYPADTTFDSVKLAKDIAVSMLSGFYVRHPLPIAGMAFQWGSIDTK